MMLGKGLKTSIAVALLLIMFTSFFFLQSRKALSAQTQPPNPIIPTLSKDTFIQEISIGGVKLDNYSINITEKGIDMDSSVNITINSTVRTQTKDCLEHNATVTYEVIHFTSSARALANPYQPVGHEKSSQLVKLSHCLGDYGNSNAGIPKSKGNEDYDAYLLIITVHDDFDTNHLNDHLRIFLYK